MKTPAELYNRLINEYTQGKGYRFFTCGFVMEVHFHPIRDDSPVAFLGAKVTPSMHLSSSLHAAWVCLEKDTINRPGGQVHSAYCTCTAGLNGCCNHVVAIIYRVEYAVRTGLTRPASTSEKCVWNVPSCDKAPNQAMLLCEQEWTKDQYLKQNDGHHSKSVKQLATSFTPLRKTQERYVSQQDTVKSDLAKLLRQYAPDSCFVQLQDKIPFPSKPQPVCSPSQKEVALTLGHPVTAQELAVSLTDHTYHHSEMTVQVKHDIPSPWWRSKIISKGPLSKPKLPRLYLCGKCADVIEDNPTSELQESVECSQCQLWFHRHCTSIRNLDAISGNQEWLCSMCK